MGIKKTQKQFEDEVYKLYGDEYIVTGTYESNKKNISVYHRRCNREIMVNPYHLLHGHGCRKCACAHLRDERRKTTEEFQKELDEMYDFEFEVVTEYDTAKTDITIRHKRCGELITKKPNRILSKKFTCPNCRKYKSKGEIKIEKILKNNDIRFEPQYKYEGLFGLGGGLLSYDFYLPDYNLLIEYQGEYHDGTARNQTKEEFEIQQEHDRRKRNYAKEHNIELMEVWYSDFDNIGKILESRLLIQQSA